MTTKQATTYTCGVCGRRLRKVKGKPRWVFSKHTNQRYCWPGEGCQK